MEKCAEEVKRRKVLEILNEWDDELQSNTEKEDTILNEIQLFNTEVEDPSLCINSFSENANHNSVVVLKTYKQFPLVLTAREISEILQISKPSAYELMELADFPLLRIGRCKRVLRQQFILWCINHQKNHLD